MDMKKTNMVGWFEIAVTDITRAKKFYEHVFETKLEKLPMEVEMWAFPMFDLAPQATGALVKSKNFTPSTNGTLIYFTAPNINATLKRVEEAGGRIEMPRSSIGEHGYIAWIHDTEGNRVALHSRK